MSKLVAIRLDDDLYGSVAKRAALPICETVTSVIKKCLLREFNPVNTVIDHGAERCPCCYTDIKYIYPISYCPRCGQRLKRG